MVFLTRRAQKIIWKITDLHIAEIVSAEGTGSNNDSFLGRSVRSGLPNSVNPKLDKEKLIHKRILNHQKRIKIKIKQINLSTSQEIELDCKTYALRTSIS